MIGDRPRPADTPVMRTLESGGSTTLTLGPLSPEREPASRVPVPDRTDMSELASTAQPRSASTPSIRARAISGVPGPGST